MSLQELSAATGNILDNHDLIATLETTKSKAGEISVKLQQARETSVEIDTVSYMSPLEMTTMCLCPGVTAVILLCLYIFAGYPTG